MKGFLFVKSDQMLLGW